MELGILDLGEVVLNILMDLGSRMKGTPVAVWAQPH